MPWPSLQVVLYVFAVGMLAIAAFEPKVQRGLIILASAAALLAYALPTITAG
jgi:hypothetical protein